MLRAVARGPAPPAAEQFDAPNLDGPAGSTTTLPIFPLGLVALPSTVTPLHIFEARYRVLFSTLMDGADGFDIEEGLVSEDSPFKGTRTFGMCLSMGNGSMCATGTSLYIETHSKLPDGRMLIENTGGRRFRVKDVLQETPVLVCEVEWIDEPQPEPFDPEAEELSQEVLQTLRSVLDLNCKLNQAASDVMDKLEREAAGRGPAEVSYLAASMFADAPAEQQQLLEMDTAIERLTRERELLQEAERFLSAQVALKGVFGEGSEDPSESSGTRRRSGGSEEEA
ncbi:unnamed protein product [Pedinophyceae sp. YPF-701]|nr:unnamed protein product [Pedinophyceae sp. YPF-701]CAG9466720.1 unnamed protein product [Pedinophyceae sp. YPF-701]